MILVVDDHADTCRGVVKLLEAGGYVACAVGGGREALDFMRGIKPELVILDWNMPEVGGLDVLRAMRADGKLVGVPVVIFSADGNSGARDEADRLGARGWITKGRTVREDLLQIARDYDR
jgi:CheY-like chemotaxis protein